MIHEQQVVEMRQVRNRSPARLQINLTAPARSWSRPLRRVALCLLLILIGTPLAMGAALFIESLPAATQLTLKISFQWLLTLSTVVLLLAALRTRFSGQREPH
jgi:hypothetical protein